MLNLDPKNMSSEEKSELDALVLDTLRMYATDTIYFKDTESRFLWNSLEHAKQLGVDDPALLYGKTDFDYFPREFAQEARDKELEIMRTGKPILGIEETLEREGLRTQVPFVQPRGSDHRNVGNVPQCNRQEKYLQGTGEVL